MELKNFFKKNLRHKHTPLTAKEAYFKTKYGTFKTPEQRIRQYQCAIRDTIKSKMLMQPLNDCANTKFRKYFCVIDFDEDMKEYINDVFKPFIENGFKVTSFSDKVKELENLNVYLVSWDKANNQ